MAVVVALMSAVVTASAQDAAFPAEIDSSTATADEDVPYGVAAGFIVGHNLLQEGDAAGALPYLHMAYRAQPEVIDIALDFQAALSAEGYFSDALEVIDKLVTQNPDSLGFRAQRAQLLLKSGESNRALADLRELRNQGYVTFSIIDAEATILAADKRPDQALDVYRDGLQRLPDDGPALYLGMTGVLQQTEQLERIPDLMTEALGVYPDVPRLWLVKSRVLAVLGEDQDALACAQQADTHFAGLTLATAVADTMVLLDTESRTRPGTAEPPPDSFVVELADFYAQRRELDKALAVLQPMAETGELSLTPSLWLGRLLLGTGRVEEGEALINDILARWPDAGRAWFLKAKASENRGEWTAALPDFERAVELSPRDPEVRLGYVRAMLVVWEQDLRSAAAGQQPAKREAEFRRQVMVAAGLVAEQDTEGQLILGYGFMGLRDYERAAWRFSLAAENDDLRLNALLQKSLCHDRLGEVDKARQDLEALHREYPRNPEVANSLGYFLAEKGVDLDQATVLVAQALEAEPGNGAFLDSMGWIHYRNGALEQALDYLIQAVNVLPEDPVILEHLGMVLSGQGKTVEALDLLRRALALGGDRERLEQVIGELEGRTGER